MNAVKNIIVRGARVHNLKNINVEIPLGKLTAIAGVSGSGKSSLALGTLYSEGSRRYLEALSTYTRRRISQTGKADLDEIKHVPAALALHQRPAVPNIRSTFGTMSELLNSLRLLFSRVGSHCCPNGHLTEPSMAVSLMLPIKCPVCGEEFYGPGAEEMAFNSDGACKTCGGTGITYVVDESTLVPDENLTIDEGAVLPWQTLMWSLMKDIARELGVRTDVPFKDLTEKEREIVFHGAPVKHHMIYQNKTSGAAGEMDFTYFNATYTVENALSKVKDESGMKRVEKFLRVDTCPDCHGTRLSAKVRSTILAGKNLAEATAMTLDDLIIWVKNVPATLPEKLRPMADSIIESFLDNAKRLIDLGLGYLSLDRAGNTLSTGERQRIQLARAVRNETTGVLYVLDEPSIGLHPSNIEGLMAVVKNLIADGNSVILVDHDVKVLKQADYMIEMGPLAGKDGGTIIAQGTVDEISKNKNSKIAGFITEEINVLTRRRVAAENIFDNGKIHLETAPIHTVKEISLDIPRGRLIAVTGVSGSGKTTLILESLIPALTAKINNEKLPAHVKKISAEGINRANLIDSAPIGINIRSTVATYSGVMDDLRKIFAAHSEFTASDFSYNTGKLRCQTCDGTGQISLDVQFLPDVTITCPDCHGARYGAAAEKVFWKNFTLPQIMKMTVNEAIPLFDKNKKVQDKLKVLQELGLGYLTLGEDTPALSGGEAQRLKLASEMKKSQADAVFVFDEPTVGLHPLDVQSLLTVFNNLVEAGATVIVIEHDLDLIANSDYIIDMGPGGGFSGGRIIAQGTPAEVAANKKSLTGKFLSTKD